MHALRGAEGASPDRAARLRVTALIIKGQGLPFEQAGSCADGPRVRSKRLWLTGCPPLSALTCPVCRDAPLQCGLPTKEMAMRVLVTAFLALSLVAGIAAPVSAVEVQSLFGPLDCEAND